MAVACIAISVRRLSRSAFSPATLRPRAPARYSPGTETCSTSKRRHRSNSRTAPSPITPPGADGGWLYANLDSTITATNCTVANNTAANLGGPAYLSESSMTLLNCIVWGNSSTASYVDGASTLLATYSCMEGGYGGEGNIASDPLFMNAAIDDVHLRAKSPCLDSATSEGAPAS